VPPARDGTTLQDLPKIRPARDSDAEAIREIYNEAVRSTTATFDTEPRSLADQLAWLREHDARHPVLVAEVGGNLAGWASLSPWSDRSAYDGTAEISVYVGVPWRSRGVGRQLVSEILSAGSRCRFHTILARVAEGNPVSRALHVTAGFTTVGVMHEVGYKFGRFLDVELMELRLGGTAKPG
jgi:L-amino acid N-acyltransferase